jgi:hypothetical protein
MGLDNFSRENAKFLLETYWNTFAGYENIIE